jgi:folate-binding protein YgfZ
MNTDWMTFLQSNTGKAYPTCAQAPALMTLPTRTSIQVMGAEAAAFLQAILTQEILTSTPNGAVHAALCNAKGRTLGILQVHPVRIGPEQEYRLSVPTGLVPELIKTLKLYLLRRKVTVTLDSDWGFIGLINPTPQHLNALGLNTTHHRALDQNITQDGIIATCEQRTEGSRVSVQGPINVLTQYWSCLSPNTEIVADWAWDHAEILDGIARVTPETYLHFVPQWLNLDLKDGISFKKGCYPGQEVVARLHYLGKPNRRLLVGQCDRAEPLIPGTEIQLRDDPAMVAGEIVTSVAQNPKSGTGQIFLAVMRLKHVHDTLLIDGAPCTLHPSTLALDSQHEDQEASTH